jgi:hypothetical protein
MMEDDPHLVAHAVTALAVFGLIGWIVYTA